MNNIQKTIFKTLIEDDIPPDPGARGTYGSGTPLCQGGIATIANFVFRGSIYYVGNLSTGEVTNMYTDAAMTIPVPYPYIRLNGSPKYLINFTSPGVVDFYQAEGTPC